MMAEIDVLDWERRSLNAWPALNSVRFGDWVFRSGGGYTKRANSANWLASPAAEVSRARTHDFREVLGEAEHFYADNRLPTIFRLTPLVDAEADRLLATAGYEELDRSVTMIALLPPGKADGEARIDAEASPEWLDGIAAALAIAPQHRRLHDRIVSLIPPPKALATVYCAGAPAGFALAALERSAVGLFDIIVRPEFRGRGLGRDLTLALMTWGKGRGAESAYLQVSHANRIAMRLYESLGFRSAYEYHYRRRAP